MSSKKVTIKMPTLSGDQINVYGQMTAEGDMVHVWTRAQNLGFYRIDRFADQTLTAASLRALFAPSTTGKASA